MADWSRDGVEHAAVLVESEAVVAASVALFHHRSAAHIHQPLQIHCSAIIAHFKLKWTVQHG